MTKNYLEFGIESYEEAKDIMEIVDEDRKSELAEYTEMLNLYPTALEIKASEGLNPEYRLHFFPMDSQAAKMLSGEDIGSNVSKILEGETTFTDVRKLKTGKHNFLGVEA